jgi:hypothetical protein
VSEGTDCSPGLWAGEPSYDPEKTGGSESLLSQYNAQFYSFHPKVHGVHEVINIQAENTAKINASGKEICSVLREEAV